MVVATAADGKRVIRIKPLHVPRAKTLVFPTIITRFEDKWSPNWKSETVYGRMDPFAFYAGTRREISVGFRILSDDEEEAKVNIAKLQKLIQYQYPRYQPSAGGRIATLKAPPYFSVEIMNVARSTKPKGTVGLQGYFPSAITVNPGFEDKKRPQYFDQSYGKLLFSDITVSFQMVVLHSHKVGFYSHRDSFAGGNAYPYSVDGKVSTSVNEGGTRRQISGGPPAPGQQGGQNATLGKTPQSPSKPGSELDLSKAKKKLMAILGPAASTNDLSYSQQRAVQETLGSLSYSQQRTLKETLGLK